MRSKKKILAILLIMAMFVTQSGFVTLADSMSDVISSSVQQNVKDDLSQEILNEIKKDAEDIVSESVEETDIFLIGESEEDADNSPSEEQEEIDSMINEPEEDENNSYSEELEESELLNDGKEDNSLEVNVSDTNEINVDNEETTTNELGKLCFDVASDSDADSDIVECEEVDNTTNETYVASTPIAEAIIDEKISLATTSDIVVFDFCVEENVATKSEINQSVNQLLGAAPVNGDTIWLGTYPQNDASGVQQEPIKWRVLISSGSEALLISDKILDNVSYHDSDTNITWDTSYIHTWLNDTFKTSAFTNAQINDGIKEKEIITQNSADANDKVFLLSTDEASSALYFSNDNERRAQGTTFAKNVDNDGNNLYVGWNGCSEWWLRSPGNYQNFAVIASFFGSLIMNGDRVNRHANGVRPAIYLDLQSPIFKDSNNSITWDLGSASFKTESALWNSFDKYQGGQKLPTNDNMVISNPGQYLRGWIINGGNTIYTEIPETQSGDITFTPVYGNYSYAINWNLGTSASWVDPSVASPSYTYGTEWPLPTADKVNTPMNKEFASWNIKQGGATVITNATSIPANMYGDVEIEAVYNNLIISLPPQPNPTPLPTKPSGGTRGGNGNTSSSRDSGIGGSFSTILDTFMMDIIPSNEYQWVCVKNQRGIDEYYVRVSKSALVAKQLMSSKDYARYYKDIDENYIQIKGAIYCLQYMNQLYYFAFDTIDGRMLTGIVEVADGTKRMATDIFNQLVSVEEVPKSKYYFNAEQGIANGIMWIVPTIFNDVQYTFDTDGKVVTEIKLNASNDSNLIVQGTITDI